MSNNQQPALAVGVVENSNTDQTVSSELNTPNSPTSNDQQDTTPQSGAQQSARDMYNQACRDINGLPLIGRIFLAIIILFVLWKATPVLDLLWIFLQLFVIPCLLLISLGVISHSSYMLVIGWMNESLVWVREKKDDIIATREES